MVEFRQHKLYYSPSSPFVRKVLIIAKEVGLYNHIELIPVQVSPLSVNNSQFALENPLAKIPTLLVPDIGPLFGSSVICQYLLSVAESQKSQKFLPSSLPSKFATLTREALADGAGDALLLMRFESIRPAEKKWDEFYAGQFGKVIRAFDELEKIQQTETNSDAWDLGHVAALCVLSYADLRFKGQFDWRDGRPALQSWFENAVLTRDSVKDTFLQ
ncbi:Glutathione S-transferase protein [Rhizoclosmatium sp. JEL0117]|nr:Glutathione S-transferase protein [Rhizoclosmatium sp. JEL0117]